MRILRLKVDGFGAIKGEFSFDPDRLTLLVDDNERGKSTLLAAIMAALYGLDNDKRTHRVLTPLDRWRPWGGGPYKVELGVEGPDGSLTITRDFEQGTVAVWNDRGQEVTSEFKEGKDLYPVGRRLTGLDMDEFAKCALVGQSEIDGVVPADEKERRTSTLHARLENAADTRVGDTNATEALRVLEEALRKYTCPEVESSGHVDTAIQRLVLQSIALETELKTLEHDYARVERQLEELSQIGEQERSAQGTLQGLDAERRESMAASVQKQLTDDGANHVELQRLRDEAHLLGAVAHLPPTAEADFRETVARHQEATRNLESLEARCKDEQSRERRAREAELAAFGPLAGATAADADRAVSLASELRQVTADTTKLRDEVFAQREALASQGHDPERIQLLSVRFAMRTEAEQRLLRTSAEVALVYQTEVASLERTRTEGTELLLAIDRLRNRWRVPGWLLAVLGLAAAATAGVVAVLLGPTMVWVSVGLGGAALMSAGLGLLIVGARARAGERADALARLSEAQRRLGQMKADRVQGEMDLSDLATRMNYRGQVDLLREWNEYTRLMEASAPALRGQERLAALETRRREAIEEATTLLGRFGGGAPESFQLERLAQAGRKALELRKGLASMEAGWQWMADERAVAEAAVAGLKERALRILTSVGLTYDPNRSWADHAAELGERAKAHVRLALINRELIPQAERRVLPAAKAAELKALLAQIESERPADRPAGETGGRQPLEVEADSRKLRETLDALQKRRTELRLEVEEVRRRYHQDHPEMTARRQQCEQALERARNFKAAVELARDTIQSVATETHRRWAEYLNVRVSKLLAAFGTRVEQLRFGDDLDFSVKLTNAQQASRGRTDLQVSAGARDQLYLAVRLAISEYLSRGQMPLPMLLDDPFATSDDERTRAGMRLLIEHFAPIHQIIVMTCHRKRHEALAEQDPELYRERTQWLDLTPASPILGNRAAVM